MTQSETTPAVKRDLSGFLERRRERIARRWADATLFRTVFTVSRDEAVEACGAVVDAAGVAGAGRPEDMAAPGLDTLRERLGRMSASRTRPGCSPSQIADEVAGPREPVTSCGTLDSARSQVVRESMLEAIVERRARFAVLDTTRVPTVDPLVAQHLMRTVAAARLMGAECVVSGARPAIAQIAVSPRAVAGASPR